MKRKCVCLAMAFLMLCQCLISGLAADSVQEVKILSAYWQSGTLYTFAQFANKNPESMDAELLLNNMQTGRTKPKAISSPDAAVHYLLLVDTSTSMLLYRKRLQEFAQALMETEQNVRISLAGFDGKLTVEKENMTTWSEVKDAISKLSFNRDGSDINGSAAAAIEYLGSKGYTAGDLPNLVVITDGEAWYDNNRTKEKEKEDQANQALAAAMAAYPEIIVHSYCTGNWNENVYGTLSKGKGLHLTGKSAKEIGGQIAAFSNSTYAVFFPLNGNDQVAQFFGQLTLCVGNAYVSYGTVRNAAVAPKLDTEHQEDVPDNPSVPETTEATVPETTDATEGIGETEGTEDTKPVDTTDTATVQTGEIKNPTDTTAPDPKRDLDRKIMLLVIGGAAVVVVLLVVILLIAGKQRKRKNSIRICIEFVAGGKGKAKNVYYLSRELLIGSDRNCDIRIPGSGGARIFLQGQMIYVEDMGAQGGTALNGMRIFSSNRLRSGDEIAVGSVRIRVLF